MDIENSLVRLDRSEFAYHSASHFAAVIVWMIQMRHFKSIAEYVGLPINMFHMPALYGSRLNDLIFNFNNKNAVNAVIVYS